MGIDPVSATETTNAAVADIGATKSVSADEPAGAGRKLRPGDRIALRLSGMRVPVEVTDVLDEEGEITLELLGSISLSGLTATEAERKIRNEYISREIYKNISVSIVVEQASYYVQGEVRQPGRFVLTESLTLIQAIAAAAGYTDFAKPSKVRIIRGDDVLYYDATRIGKRLDKDPLIRRGDTIIVERTSL
jgi:protein involved in polysaccharide export with SLBB domain